MGNDDFKANINNASQLESARIKAFGKIDLPWPSWVLAKFKATYCSDQDLLLASSSNSYWTCHSTFETNPSSIVFERSNQRSVVVITDGERSIGEAWLRLAIAVEGKSIKVRRICEMYRYRRGWRDKLLSEMDNQPMGAFIVPTRVDDMYCTINKRDQQITLQTGDNVASFSQMK